MKLLKISELQRLFKKDSGIISNTGENHYKPES